MQSGEINRLLWKLIQEHDTILSVSYAGHVYNAATRLLNSSKLELLQVGEGSIGQLC